MHVTMRQTAAGPKWHCAEGKTSELPDEEAQALIAAGQAFEVPAPKPRKLAADEDESETASANAEGETAAENDGEKQDEKKPESVMKKLKAAKKPATEKK